MIEDFGSHLKSERELRGVPLEEIATTTKIHIRFLRALENNQFDDLPGDVFIKGYIQSIAKVIGSNPNEMLSAYDEVKKNQSSKRESENVPVKEETPKDKNLIFILSLTLLLLASVGLVINIIIQKPTESSQQSKPEMVKPDQKAIGELPIKDLSDSTTGIEKSSSTLKVPAQSKIQIDEASNDLSEESLQSVNTLSAETKKNSVLAFGADSDTSDDKSNNKSEDSASTLVTENDMPLKLTIKVKDNVWFNLTVDGSRQEDFISPKGTEKVFYGKDNFKITVGNRNLIDLQLNNKTLSLPNEGEGVLVQDFIIHPQLID